MSTPEEVLGTTIRRARRARSLRQQDVADELGVNVKAVQRWERGTNTPRGLTLVHLLRFFRKRMDNPDLAALDQIVMEEVDAAAQSGQPPDEQVLTLMHQLSHSPEKLAQWLSYGTSLLDGDSA